MIFNEETHLVLEELSSLIRNISFLEKEKQLIEKK